LQEGLPFLLPHLTKQVLRLPVIPHTTDVLLLALLYP
jgi:hypothetical protein